MDFKLIARLYFHVLRKRLIYFWISQVIDALKRGASQTYYIIIFLLAMLLCFLFIYPAFALCLWLCICCSDSVKRWCFFSAKSVRHVLGLVPSQCVFIKLWKDTKSMYHFFLLQRAEITDKKWYKSDTKKWYTKWYKIWYNNWYIGANKKFRQMI